MAKIDSVIFDLDGVLVQSEGIWDAARRDLAAEHGVDWPSGATDAMMGMSSLEWSRYVSDEVGVPLDAKAISAEVVRRVATEYGRSPPWIEGALAAVRRIGGVWRLGLATSSNREIIDLVIERGSLADLFAVTVSSEEVSAGKPAPDVYLETARRLRTRPEHCAAVEDSTNGLLAAHDAAMRVVAIPNPAHPPTEHGLGVADVVLGSINELTPEAIAG